MSPTKPTASAPTGPPPGTVSCNPTQLDQLTSTMVPLDEDIGTTAYGTVYSAWESFAATKPDPAFLPTSVLADTLPQDAQVHAINCTTDDAVPARVATAFRAADGGNAGAYVTETQLDAAMTKLGKSWNLTDSISHNRAYNCSVPGNGTIIGPDGLPYTIVSPEYFQVESSSGPPHTGPEGPDVLPLDGSVWVTTGNLTGFTDFGKHPDSTAYTAPIMIGLLGGDPSSGTGVEPADKSAYVDPKTGGWNYNVPGNFGYSVGTVSPEPNPGQPTLDNGTPLAVKSSPYGLTPSGTGVGDPQPGVDPTSNSAVLPTDPAQSGGQLIGQFLTGGIGGAEVAIANSNSDLYQYHVTLYQGPGGQRRALIGVTKIWQDSSTGKYQVSNGTAYYNAQGKLTINMGPMNPMGGN